MYSFDILSEFQNDYQGYTIDAGLQARYEIFDPTYLDFSVGFNPGGIAGGQTIQYWWLG